MDSVYGQHDANWLAFYNYFRVACDLKSETEKLLGLINLAKSAGWAIPHQNICWVSERHSILNRDERGRLHSVTSPAVLYPDGWAIYAIHGVRVPEYIVTRPNEITTAKIEKEENTEVRRVMIERYGQEKYLKDSNAKEIHKDEFGTLFLKEIPDDEPLVMVKVINSTPEIINGKMVFKDYFLRVPPDIKTAKEAVAWTFAKSKEEYIPLIQS